MLQLQARGLAALRGEERIFSDLSFDLASGEALVVTGPNGSGKSTLIRTIAGLLPLDSGEVIARLDDEPIARVSEACHYLGHRNAMKRELSVEENLDFWRRHLGDFAGGSGVDADAAADALGLASLLHLPFGYLSAGQQRRMAMAKLLVAWRPVWILDEPTAALDDAAEDMFAGLVSAHLARGGIAIAATHQPLGLEGVQELTMTGFAGVPEEVW